MQQNTVIISTEEYNRLREYTQKWKDQKLTRQEIEEQADTKYLNMYRKRTEELEKKMEDNINKVIGGTHKIVYLGQAPSHIDTYQFSARHIYEVVTIGTDAPTLKVQKPLEQKKIPMWMYWLYWMIGGTILIYIGGALDSQDLLWLFR